MGMKSSLPIIPLTVPKSTEPWVGVELSPRFCKTRDPCENTLTNSPRWNKPTSCRCCLSSSVVAALVDRQSLYNYSRVLRCSLTWPSSYIHNITFRNDGINLIVWALISVSCTCLHFTFMIIHSLFWKSEAWHLVAISQYPYFSTYQTQQKFRPKLKQNQQKVFLLDSYRKVKFLTTIVLQTSTFFTMSGITQGGCLALRHHSLISWHYQVTLKADTNDFNVVLKCLYYV